MHLLKSRSEDIENGGARLGVLAAQDTQQGLALGLVGAAVDDQGRFAMAFMDGAGPDEHARHPQPVELGCAVMALMDLEPDHGAAMAISRQAIELAGTAIRAIAIGKLMRPDGPIGHGIPPIRLQCWQC